jgi:hypothetical protein
LTQRMDAPLVQNRDDFLPFHAANLQHGAVYVQVNISR